jgi:hypothetical protein
MYSKIIPKCIAKKTTWLVGFHRKMCECELWEYNLVSNCHWSCEIQSEMLGIFTSHLPS